MRPILYYSRNPNPRLAVAVARYLRSPVELRWAASFAPENAAKFRALNPTQLLPILVEKGTSLWEADAIACRLSMMAGDNFWRIDADMPDMIRWISWGKSNFVHACDMVHFERGTKQRYHLGALDEGEVREGLERFHRTAHQLDAHLKDRTHLLDSGLSYADFRMATFLPYNDVADLPLAEYPYIQRWNEALQRLPAWQDPFDGLNAPPLPSIAVAAKS